MINPGIIICTRLDSSRIPQKVLQKIGDKTLLEILIERLLPAKIPICLAYPEEEIDIFKSFIKGTYLKGYSGHKNYVLKRFYEAAKLWNFNPIIRITHDNILQFSEYIEKALDYFFKELRLFDVDYLFIKNGIPGTKFEIISFDLVEKAYEKYKDGTEYLTYPFRELAKCKYQYEMPCCPKSIPNLAIDYPEDLQLLRIIHDQNSLPSFDFYGAEFDDWNINNGNKIAYESLCRYIDKNPTLMSINHRPLISIYTCAYNAEKTISQAIKSVIHQTFTDWEYIIYDDGSDDNTSILLAQMKNNNSKINIIKSDKNKGLSIASNNAIKYTKGKYILRLDADDELLLDALELMVAKIKQEPDIGILYSDCWRKIPFSRKRENYPLRYHFHDNHHENIGCALIRRDVWKEVKFRTDLEYCDGLDFYIRAKEICKIAEIKHPLWIYNQRSDSMSHTGGEKRKKIRNKILKGNDMIRWSKGKISI